MHKPDQAIKWLEMVADGGFPCYPLFEKDANLDNLRQDPPLRHSPGKGETAMGVLQDVVSEPVNRKQEAMHKNPRSG
jgi:hypothetical protein